MITPTFAAVSPICSGATLSSLPSISLNGISGTWNPALDNTQTTTYSFIPNPGQCANMGTLTVVVNSNPAIPTISASGSLTFCEGGNVILTSSESIGNLWSTGETTQSITVNTSGDYFVTVSNLNGCSANSLPTTVNVNPNPTIPIITPNGSLTFCDGENVVLISSESTGNSWSNGASSQVISVNFAGSYSVTFTDVNGCSATSAPITVTVYPLPAAPTISANGSLTFCEGGNVVLNSSQANGILWSNGSAFQSLTIYSSGDYSVEYTDVNGCSATSLPTTVTVNPNPAIPTISANGSLTFCEGGNVILTSSESIGNLWSTGETTQSITVNSSGIYAVSFTDINGCIANSSLIPVIVNSLPAANVSMLTNDTITAFPIGQNYQWINCANDLPISGANDINYGVEVNGDYAVIVTNSSGCMDTSSCISVDLPFLNPDAGLVIFPNPTTGNFSVSINTDQFVDVIEISFLNSVGNIISTQTAQVASGVQIINFTNNQLQAGLYLIVVSDQNGNQLTGNVLIQ
jgi:predicted RNase H-like HicB family nuclease